MTGWIILGAIILLIAFLLNMKLRAEIKFYGGKLDFKVKYLLFTIFPFKEKKKKPKKEISPPKKDLPSAETENYLGEKPYTVTKAEVEAKREAARKEAEATENLQETEKRKEKLSEKIDRLSDLIEKAKIIWSSSKKGLTRLFKHIYIDGIVIDFVIAEGDAYDTAMRYGTVNAVTYNVINAVRFLFPVTVKTVDIACDFDGKKSRYDGEVKVTIRPATIFSAVFSILFGLIKNYSKLVKPKGKQNSKKVVTT
ncbi:MAG: hypothetical protein K2J76_05425 [Oscillospiraceae bacterium]|nr:hypothetical protein [Oscillospiraceae bacterium]